MHNDPMNAVHFSPHHSSRPKSSLHGHKTVRRVDIPAVRRHPREKSPPRTSAADGPDTAFERMTDAGGRREIRQPCHPQRDLGGASE